MEPVSTIVVSLALGAGAAAGKEVVSAFVKDSYAAMKATIKDRYPKVSIEQLEQEPESKIQQTLVEEGLIASNASQDRELVAAALVLICSIREHTPHTALAVGVDLKDVEAANVHLAEIVAIGTGVRIEHGVFTGDIDIRDVRAGATVKNSSRND